MPGNGRAPIKDLCKRFAFYVHRNDIRKLSKKPFIVHPQEVANILQGAGYDQIMVAAGWAHDGVEDHSSEWNFPMLERWLDHPDAAAVIHLLRPVTYDFSVKDRNMRRGWYCHALKQTPDALPLSVADKIDNVTDIVAHLNRDVDAFRILEQSSTGEISYLNSFLTLITTEHIKNDPRLGTLVETLRTQISFLRQISNR